MCAFSILGGNERSKLIRFDRLPRPLQNAFYFERNLKSLDIVSRNKRERFFEALAPSW